MPALRERLRCLARHRTALAGAGLGLLALAGPPLAVRAGWLTLRVSEDREIAFKLGLGLLVAAALALEQLRARRSGVRRAGLLLAALASLSVATYFNFGFFHGTGFVHYWDQFHYQLGSKYFPELGYDGLYVASIGAQADAYPGTLVAEYARDLRSYRVERVTSLFPHMREVWRRFTPERWQAFVADNRQFVDATSSDHLGAWRLDHGYNATPAWTFEGRLFDVWWPTSHGVLVALGLLDVALLAGAFACVFATFGARVGCFSLVLLGFGYAGRFYWTGGAFLRHDWLAASLLGVCMLERRRFTSAGALLGWAAMVRLFPALLLLGPVVRTAREGLAARAATGRWQTPAWARRLALGVAAAVVLGFAAGSATGRGPGAWLEFAGAIRMHAAEWLTNNTGLTILFSYDRAILERRDVDWTAPEPWMHVQPEVARHRRERRPAILAAQLLFLAVIALAIWRLPLAEATLAGFAAVFALLTPTAYYWVALVALPLARRPALVWGALALDLGMFGVHLCTPAFEMRYAAFSAGLGVLFLAWLGPHALRTARDLWRAPERAQAPVSAAS
jgi:hypothetical protein